MKTGHQRPIVLSSINKRLKKKKKRIALLPRSVVLFVPNAIPYIQSSSVHFAGGIVSGRRTTYHAEFVFLHGGPRVIYMKVTTKVKLNEDVPEEEYASKTNCR